MNVIIVLSKLYNKILWKITATKLAHVGENCRVGKNFWIREPEHISIGDNFEGGNNISIHAWKNYKGKISEQNPRIIIGNNVSMTERCGISCMNEVIISDGVLLGVNTFITDNAHGDMSRKNLEIPPNQRELYSKGPVVIGKNVWIGRNVCVMPNVTIGEGAIIGANAVVTHNIPAYSVAAGVPARVIKQNAAEFEEGDASCLR